MFASSLKLHKWTAWNSQQSTVTQQIRLGKGVIKRTIMVGVVCLKETQHVASRLREKNETPKHVASSFFVALPVLPKKKN